MNKKYLPLCVVVLLSMMNEHKAIASQALQTPSLIVSIGVAARASAASAPLSSRLLLLTNLATAQIKAGDIAGAKAVLADARSSALQANEFQNEYSVNNAVALTVLAGDDDAAMNFIQTIPPQHRISALSYFGEAKVRKFDNAGALAAVHAIDDVRAHLPPAVSAPPTNNGNASLGVNDGYDAALWKIGTAFVAKNSPMLALDIANKMSNNVLLIGLLGEIANAHHKTGNQKAVTEILQRIKIIIDSHLGDQYSIIRSASKTFALCGDSDSAQAMVATLPPESRPSAYSQLVETLSKSGDTDHALKLALAVGNGIEDLITVGKALAEKGNYEQARTILTSAHDKALATTSINHFDQVDLITRVINGQIDIGAFSDAVATAVAVEPVNRSQYLLRAINEEAKRKNDKAIHDTISVAIKSAEDSPPGYATKAFADLAVTLSKAGYTVESKTVLDKAQQSIDPSRGFTPKALADLASSLEKRGYTAEAKAVLSKPQQSIDAINKQRRIDGLKVIKQAQIAMGDKAGVDATAREIQRAKISGLPVGTVKDSKIERALTNLELANQGNADQQKEALARALADLNGNAQLLEVLIFLQRDSPSMNLRDKAYEQIQFHDFDGAMKTIDLLTGAIKDSCLVMLANAQASTRQIATAFDTVKLVADPYQRAYALTNLISTN